MKSKFFKVNQEPPKMFIENFLLKYRPPIIIGFHLISIFFAHTGAFFIRFDFKIPPEYLQTLLDTLPFILFSRMATYYYYKTYTASWRFAYLRDLIDVVKAIISGSALFLTSLVLLDMLQGFPRSIIFLEAILSLSIMSGTKFMFRYYTEYPGKKLHKVTKNVLIVGAGKAGVLMLNEIRNNRSLGINVAGFVDDNDYLKGTNIQGVAVLGRTEDIPELVKKNIVDEIIVAIPSADYRDIVRISEIAQNSEVKVRILPGLGKLIQDGTFTNQLKDISTDELLGRKVIKFCRESDRKLMEKEIEGKSVLVTGAGGSIGSELCRQVAQFKPCILIMYERYETSLYEIEMEIKKKFPDQLILPVLGDILDTEKFNNTVESHNIELIYHAAAYKHVPMMEREPIEAVRNNVFGTMNVADLAVKNKVGKFVLISTDKAVNPANIMGTTKRVAEMIVQFLNGNGTIFATVRFGNVIGSNGSVIPIFKKQIAEGGPLTVTHPEMTRYFMSIAEAVQLVMTAGAMGKGGEIFLLDMGKPVKIMDVATALIKLSGLEPEKDIDIIVSGIRPGEKLHEELYWQGEGIVPTDNKKITMLKSNGFEHKDLIQKIDLLRQESEKGDVKSILELLKEIVPESLIQ